MKNPSLHYFRDLFCLVILLGTHSCNCNNTTSEEPTPQNTPLPQKGYWHTGTHQPGDTLKLTDNLPDSYLPHLYQRPYEIYRVRHDGSCAFRSFIPILLHGILGTGELDKWITHIDTSIYQPAQKTIPLINWSEDIMPKSYRDDVIQGTLYKKFKDLLYKLNGEPTPRPLKEDEIQPSVDFLRQCVVMKLITYLGDPQEGLKYFLQDKTRRVTSLSNFWGTNSDFDIFKQFYAIMFQKNQEDNKFLIKYHRIHGTIIAWNNNKKMSPTSPQELAKGFHRHPPDIQAIFRQKGFPEPEIMMYHHDNIYYDYIIYKKSE